MTEPIPLGAEPADLAAEHALGVLDGPERAEAERRLLADPAFAAEVEGWRWRLARLADEAAPHDPPAHVWTAIAQRLDAGAGGVVELKLRRTLAAWRGATALAGVVAAVLAVALTWPRSAPAPLREPPAAPLQTASLSGTAGGSVVFVAVLDPGRRELVLTPAAVSRTAGRSPQLWVIPAGGKPVSLGLAAFALPVRIPVDAALGVATRRTLAVSLEPVGGSPTGQPTGPVVATGELKAL